MEKLISLIFTLVGLYPQYRTVQTVLRGRGLLPGDWRREHKFNNLNIYMIEPLCESMLQVNMRTVRWFDVVLTVKHCPKIIHLSGLCPVYNSVRCRGTRPWKKCARFCKKYFGKFHNQFYRKTRGPFQPAVRRRNKLPKVSLFLLPLHLNTEHGPGAGQDSHLGKESNRLDIEIFHLPQDICLSPDQVLYQRTFVSFIVN